MNFTPILTIFLIACGLIACALYSFICYFERQYNRLESRSFDPVFDPAAAPADADETPFDAAYLRRLSESQQRRADLN